MYSWRIGFGVFLSLTAVCHGLQWTSTATVPDNITLPACEDQDVSLAWDFNTTGQEHIVNVEWRFKPNGASTDVILATEVNGHFFADPSASQRMEYIPGAGIRLIGVKSTDNGVYSVRVNVNSAGTIQTHVQNVELAVNAASVSTGNGLVATVEGARYFSSSGDHHLMLSCGNFDPLWIDSVHVSWTTPSGQSLNSTEQGNGTYLLAVPNPVDNGEYSCHVADTSPATRCIPLQSPVRRGATVVVNGVQARLMLLDSELQTMKGSVQTLQTSKDQLTHQIASLQANNSAMVGLIQTLQAENTQLQADIQNIPNSFPTPGIRLVGGSNDHEGRVEIQASGVWGTVCDDGFTNQAARVVCRQLRLPTAGATMWGSAYFGQGSGRILLDEVNCHGDEGTLFACRSNDVGSNDCEHSEDVGVTCA